MTSDTCSTGSRDTGATGLVGISDWAKKIRATVTDVAACPSNVLITGPTGTGKEVIARAIHAHSPRAAKPFIPVDCAGAAGPLFASHIFGHLQGAFTGADHAALGCFRAANGGTIFLDEIGELECDMQTKLLRVLQQRTVVPMGSYEEVPVDVRVIAATNRDLKHEVGEGRFREDLYYRLNVVSLRTTALQDRPQDIEDLARHFLNKLAITHGLQVKRLSDEALGRLRGHNWPGNVRQLENVLEHAVFLGRGEEICAEDILIGEEDGNELAGSGGVILPILTCPKLTDDGCTERVGDCCMAVLDGHWRTMEEVEREHIRRTLALTGCNQSAAARLLGMERHQLTRKISKYGLDVTCPKRDSGSKRVA